MRKLFILRHGIAVPYGTPGVPEEDRQLTPRGEKRIRQIGRGLSLMKLGLDRIITSPLVRARRTAQIVAQETRLLDRLEISSSLAAGVDAQSIADWLRTRNEERLMIVGHNPALSDLVGLMVLGEPGRCPVELKKGGVAALSHSPIYGPRFQLDWIAPPALLRRLS